MRKEITSIGLINKYLGPLTIINQYEHGNKTTILLKEGGVFGFLALSEIKRVLVNGEITQLLNLQDDYYIVDCSKYKDEVVVEVNYF
ncbi:hypothetical protein KHA96_21635 [Bacillus sp. FJAT-49711]|uniref:hypothetical protein n=1 Tax=Bacillus sp. FJAT-49711 TaxID=2833585 RepID=UPI001BCA1238|nr:hypothetical protein [Bacillus sp. FJAT-49711]MBS4220902.1 hypothetical protein [Bacillus sp. FJAT-49711]